ncbi:Adenine nucleotide alpha hydrolases-like superfamily protein isoform 2 [Hibiscus syriacus]|uniref:Adenine nucleotide alpha hydrolases-like superfamily protein isoform 2 n=1 Tax=Hibiscus syriacus TaxID=106335 RepID=A0A6A2YGE6_HIBSY|nr:Adenine nucleotide alpha hydrolases-like superfamily protein isoform 2 [Hibiscus syriacus]
MESPNKGKKKNSSDNNSDPKLPSIKIHLPSSPRHSTYAASSPTPVAGARRKIGVAVDLSEESAYAVRWTVQNYLRPGDAVILLHVSPTSVLYGADWGPVAQEQQSPRTPETKKQLEDDFDALTASKAADLAKPLKEAGIPFKIHIVKDHDMRERLCIELERLGLSAVVMGSRGYGAELRGNDGKLGSVTDYCVHHCVCPVVVVRYPDEKDDGNIQPVTTTKEAKVEGKGGKS